MSGMIKLAMVSVAALSLQGCIARTVVDIATMPIKATAQAADWATTSQDEADRSRGREIRREEEREGRRARRGKDDDEDDDD